MVRLHQRGRCHIHSRMLSKLFNSRARGSGPVSARSSGERMPSNNPEGVAVGAGGHPSQKRCTRLFRSRGDSFHLPTGFDSATPVGQSVRNPDTLSIPTQLHTHNCLFSQPPFPHSPASHDDRFTRVPAGSFYPWALRIKMIRMGETPDSAASPASTKSIPWKGLPFINPAGVVRLWDTDYFCEYPMDEFVINGHMVRSGS